MMIPFNFAIITVLLTFAASSSLAMVGNQRNFEDGFECGNTFFAQDSIARELTKARNAAVIGAILPYKGPLYNGMMGYNTLSIFPDRAIFGMIKSKFID